MRVLHLVCLIVSPMVLLASSREKAQDLLTRWCDGLMAVQVKAMNRPELDGGLLCPACGLLHGRIGDVAYPFVHVYSVTGNRKYLEAAEAAVDWCEANMLLPTGLYRNDRQTYWRSTTAFFAIPLWKTLRDYGSLLPEATRKKWRGIFLRASDALYGLYDDEFSPVVNYECIFPEIMFLAWKETGDAKYLDAAKRKARFVLDNGFNDEGFLVGEGNSPKRRFEKSRRGCHPIDLGYNLEESLTALIEYADMAGDKVLRDKAVASARLQMAFVLPDGAIDDSCGSRSVKWTYYGSRTSDGMLSLLSLLKNDIPYAARMADRVLDLYARCTGGDGLIAGGLMYGEAEEPSCVHHSFARAKTLVEYLRGGLAACDPTAGRMPREEATGSRYYKSLDAHLVAVGPWRATVSANDAFNIRHDAAVSGGTMSLLWHESIGPVFVGTMGRFFYAEPHNMQDDRHDMVMHCLAPRVVSGKKSNIFDYESLASGSMKNGSFEYSARGKLTDEKGEKSSAYAIDYALDKNGLVIRASSDDANARYVMPLIAGRRDVVSVDGCKVRICRGNASVTLESSVPVVIDACDRGDRIWSPVSGMLCVPLSVPLTSPVVIRLRCE